jgi:hypothetical protein
MMRVPDGKLVERQLVGEEGRCRRRELTIEQVFADLHRLLGHSAGDSKNARICDLAAALEVGESSIGNVLLRLVPVGDTLLTAMYGDEPCGTLHPDWAAEPEDWGPISPWGAPAPAETSSPAVSLPPPVGHREPEAAIPSPPATIPPAPAPVPLAHAIAEVAAVAPPAPAPATVFTDLPSARAEASDSIVNADAIAAAVAPLLHDPLAAAVDLLRDQRELARQAAEAAARSLTLAREKWESLVSHQGKIESAIEVLEGLAA